MWEWGAESRWYINESLGKYSMRSKERARETYEMLCSCSIVLGGGVTMRGSHGPAVRLDGARMYYFLCRLYLNICSMYACIYDAYIVRTGDTILISELYKGAVFRCPLLGSASRSPIGLIVPWIYWTAVNMLKTGFIFLSTGFYENETFLLYVV